ncbi:MAG: D-sedoheptulose 7-phosphate isomerase [Deltaproteobacteria bacterium]|nr:D-sedoheptulose 7-phosphate isomerase [Deltaproteobacteria bacterium]
MQNNDELIRKIFEESARVKERFFSRKNLPLINMASEMIAEAFKAGGKLMVAGNGGSAGDAQHIAGEFVNKFEIERPPLPALALSTDSSVITSIGNDYSFDQIFSKQVRALGKKGDVLLAISTSGSSRNVINAAEAAKNIGVKTIALTGKGGGELGGKADLLLNVDADSTPRIQEVHITVCHIICALVDAALFQRV